jgi:mono/diheme cytochrome c family protein
MDPSRDNPLVRFTTFWWGMGTFFIFAVGLVLVWFFTRSSPTTLEDAAAVPRYATRAKIDSAGAANLSTEAIEAAMVSVGKKFVGTKPAAVELPAQVIPGSPTALKLAAAPVVDTKAVDATSDPNEPIDPKVMELGKTSYMSCLGCHGTNGEGVVGPPLAGSEWVTGPVSNLVRIQLRGLQGAITVAGKEYNVPGGMVALSYQTDEQIAAVLTYIRNSFGNKASGVKPEQVAALRSEVGKPQCVVADLIKP